MEMQPDFRELLALFNGKSVEYLIVGKDSFVRNKRAIGRAKDLADIEAIE